LIAEANAFLDAVHEAIEMTSWPHWRKDQFIRAVETLAEAQLVMEGAMERPQDAEFHQRFAAAYILFAKC
jgi:hypothetical protein